MKLLLLAWRNIGRNRRRTFITALAVAFACMILSFMISLQQSTYKTAIEAATSIFQGHLQIQRKGYQEDPRSYVTLKELTRLKDRVKQVPEVREAAFRITTFALLSSEDRTYGVQIVGVEPATEPAVSSIPGTVRRGRFLQQSDSYSMVMGETLAKNLHVSLGDEVTLLGQGADGSMAAAVFTVVGLFQSGSVDLDRLMVEIPFSIAQETFTLPGQAHAVVVKTSNLERSSEIQAEIETQVSALGDYVALTWEGLNPGLKESIELDLVSGWLFLFSLILIVAFGVLNTFLMSLLERTREFGLLMSLGMTPGSLMVMVIIELFILLFLGFLPGCVFGALIILYFAQYGLSIPGSEEINKLWNLPATLYPEVNLEFLLTGPVVVVVTTFILVVPFSLRLRRLQPVEALRAV